MLKGQGREDVIDEPAHLRGPPAGPGPDLRRAVEDHRDAVPFGPPGEPPVETRKVDEHADVGRAVEEAPLGLPRKIDEPMDREDHPQEPHHRQPREVGHEPAAGRLHGWPAEPDTLDARHPRAELPHEQCRVMIARGLTG